MNVYGFKKSLLQSRLATSFVGIQLLSRPDIQDVLNREDDPAFRKRGIDLEVKTKSGLLGVEVKGDTYDSGNFFFETISVKQRDVKGCFLTSEADIWCYYLFPLDELYWLPMPQTRDYVMERAGKYRTVSVGTSKGGKVGYTSEGMLVPIKEIVDNVPGVERFTGVKKGVDSLCAGLCSR